jgi:hypothetical protein
MSKDILKKDHPWVLCDNCCSFFDHSMKGQKCECGAGYIRPDVRPNTWFECQICDATGIVSGSKCGFCKGKGWLYTDIFYNGVKICRRNRI